MLGQLHRGEVFKTQPQHAQAELVLGAVANALDKTRFFKRVQHAKHRRTRQPQLARQVCAAELRRLSAEFTEQLQPTLKRWDDVTVGWRGVVHGGECFSGLISKVR